MTDTLTWLDYALIGLVGISILIGVIRGFVREVISVVVWVAAFWVAIVYSGQVADRLTPFIDSALVRMVLGFAALFVVTLLVGAVVSYIGRLLVGRTGLTGTDRLLGMVFGGLRGGLLVGLVVLGAGLTALPQENWWQSSRVVEIYHPWVCHDRVGGWVENVPVDGSAVLGYWKDYCVDEE